MKIAVVSSTALPSPPVSYGGLEYVAYLRALALHQLGYDVTLFAVPNPTVDYPFDIVELSPGPEEKIDKNDLKGFDKIIDETHKKVAGGTCIYHDFLPALGNCNKHIAISIYHKYSLESIYGRFFDFVYDPVDTSWLSPMKKEPLVAWYGRINKGANEFLRFLKTHVKADVVVIGDDSMEKIDTKLVEEMNAAYYGLVHDRKEVGKILGKAAAVVSAFHPLYREAFGMWAVEAVAAGALPLAPQEATYEIVKYMLKRKGKHYLLSNFKPDYITIEDLLTKAIAYAEVGYKIVNEKDASLFNPVDITRVFLHSLVS